MQGKKAIPTNPLRNSKTSLKPDLSKEKKKERIEKFIQNLPEKIVSKLKKIEDISDQIDDKYDRDCPFAPALCNKSRDIVEKRRIKPIYERYESDHQKKVDKIQKEKLERERLEIEELRKNQVHRTDQKQLNRTNRSSSTANLTSQKKSHPGYLRNSKDNSPGSAERKTPYDTQKEWLEKKNSKILQMRMSHADRELMEEEDYKFAPTINKKSASKIKLDFFQRQE